jgi:hypothetical protein
MTAVIGCYNGNPSRIPTSPSPLRSLPTAVPTPTMVASVKMKIVKGENQIEFIKLDVTRLWEPLVNLSAALKQDRKSKRFRVAWWIGVGSLNSSSTVLYNRQKKTLVYYCRGGYGVDIPTKIEDHYLYTGVTDNVIDKLSKSMFINPRGASTSAAGFDQLPSYGCKQYKLS